MTPLDWPSVGPLAEVRPVSDLVLLAIRDAAREVRVHEHPARDDLYCLNLHAFMGERMAAVLRRLADAEAEVQAWKARNTALADEALRLLTPAPGPEDAAAVWVAAAMNGVEMHRLLAGEARRTACDKAAFGGRETTAANAMQRWGSQPCPRCWPVTP